MKNFGGDWTQNKIEILVMYAEAYLTIMNKYPYWKLIYFDGFAGSGLIEKNNEEKKTINGAAKRILDISHPKQFDNYYFVEKDNKTYADLIRNIKNDYPNKSISLVQEDCNVKLIDMSKFLKDKRGKHHHILAYIDPYGMQLKWNALESLKDLPVDLWILVPTGIGANRLLKNNGKIKDSWLEKLEVFLGIDKSEIKKQFYEDKTVATLFGDEELTTKYTKSIKRLGELYKSRLNGLFKFVSDPYELRNSTNSIMYHFFLASNNPTAVKIGNEIITKFNNKY